MKIRVRDIRPEGVELTETITAQSFSDVDENLVKFTAPLIVKARFEKVSKTVLAHTDLKTNFEIFCARCLEPVARGLSKHCIFDFPVTSETDTIELDDEIRQEVLLALPTKVLCKDDCQGLCIGCGVNLNSEKCKCRGSKS